MTIDDLAIFGGEAAFKESLHIGRPNIGNRERLLARINDLLDRKWLTNGGPYVHEFESRIAKLVGVKNCIVTCNATVALEIAIRAAGLKGEVIVPSFSFIATAHALQWQQITPVFCDIDPRTHTIDPGCVEQLITPHTTGVIGVHLWGRPCHVERLVDIGRRYNIKILFDAAHAFGCSYKGRMLGSFGDAEVFSFHATKFLNSLEGGAVVTNDDGLAQRIRLMKNFGFVEEDEVDYIGTNAKMHEMSAAMGLTSLESQGEFTAANYRNYLQYREQLADIPGICQLQYDLNESCNFQYIVLEVDETLTSISRDQLRQILRAENVLARRYFYPGCHRMEPYRSRLRNRIRLPHTDRLSMKVLCLPTGTAVGPADIERICQLIRFVVQNGCEVRKRLMSSGKPEQCSPAYVD